MTKVKEKTIGCPRCGGDIDGYPALSRRDNKTNICSNCGQDEAVVDMAMAGAPEMIRRDMEFTRKLLREAVGKTKK